MLDKQIDPDDLIALLSLRCVAAGSMSAWARQKGVSTTYVSEVLRGKKEPGGKLLKAIGYRRVVMYEEVR
jgi:hypothetical protein